jgi:hypothetical protein
MKEDFCPKCGKEINLALGHAYDRDLQRPVHRECQQQHPPKREDSALENAVIRYIEASVRLYGSLKYLEEYKLLAVALRAKAKQREA